MRQPTVTEVFLVEVHTDRRPKSWTSYAAEVYLRLEGAKADVQDWATNAGMGPIRWVNRGGVWYAYGPEEPDDELYRVVPLGVRG